MKTTITIIAATLVATAAHADDWTGQDKVKHFAAGAAVASVVTVATSSERAGFWAGAAAGLAKEVYDSRASGHTVSARDLLVTVYGAYVGAKIGGFVISPAGVTYSASLNLF